MFLVICGESASGKDTILRALKEKEEFKFQPLVSCTTREKRPGECDGSDYYFVSRDKFLTMIDENEFIEFTEYSGKRFYGLSKKEVMYKITGNPSANYCAILTPSGLRQLKAYLNNLNIPMKSMYVTASLGNRVNRYISRCGIDKFNFSDMSEISERVNRDFGMFAGIEKEVDYVFENNSVKDFLKIMDTLQTVLQQNNKETEEEYEKE